MNRLISRSPVALAYYLVIRLSVRKQTTDPGSVPLGRSWGLDLCQYLFGDKLTNIQALSHILLNHAVVKQ